MPTGESPTVNLPGYTLHELIGSGGYGEVWSAEAPGGLRKAIKFVYGRQDEKRALNELRALDRVREVRHPFLLSLERIEIVEGRLVVVTELADGSLRDRFTQCVASGMPGIPRDELLRYLSEAADALDFLLERHEIAHLDIKPENMLVLAGHVKVADFGLAKSIRAQTEASLVGGMTPAYAAPEVFRGQPGSHSDQYSLAIVYQELLSGRLPFSGASAAELTLSHLNHDPNLASLSEADRYVISRALSKDASHRFESCQAFVQALAASGDCGASFSVASNISAPLFDRTTKSRTESAPASGSVTEVFSDDDAFAVDSPTRFELPSEQCSGPRLVEPLLESTLSDLLTPTLVVGVGSAAGKVMRELRRQMTERWQSPSAISSLSMLLIDTDLKALAEASRGFDSGAGLRPDETIALPLRRPQDYREKAERLLGWLSRRWLYNIPRSLRTEGIRPLGRLALVDHARQLFQRIRRAMSETISEANLVSTGASLGTQFRPSALRVVVVTSISGGSGGGMLLDIAFALRALGERMGLDSFEQIGILMHSAGREAHRGELARVNAFASLAELAHFMNSDAAFPGDDGCGLPSRPAAESPFDATYLLPQGDNLDGPQFDRALRSVADYILLDSLTPTQHYLRSCRQIEGYESPRLRTFAIQRQDARTPVTIQAMADIAISRLMEKWRLPIELPNDSNIKTDAVVLGASNLISQLKLDAMELLVSLQNIAEAVLGGDIRATLDGLAASRGAKTRSGSLEIIDSAFASSDSRRHAIALCRDQLQAAATQVANKQFAEISKWISRHADAAGSRLTNVQAALNWVSDHLKSMSAQLEGLAVESESLRVELAAVWQAGGGWRNPTEQQIREFQASYLPVRIRCAAASAAQTSLSHLSTLLVSIHEILAESNRKIINLAQICATRPQKLPDGDNWETSVSTLCESLESKVQAELFTQRGGLLAVLAAPEGEQELIDFLNHFASLGAQQLSTPPLTSQGNQAPLDAAGEFPTLPTGDLSVAVRKVLLHCSPTTSQPQLNSDGLSVTLEVPGPISEQFCLTEGSDISLPLWAATLIDFRRDYAEFAERIHSRRDIGWRSLTAIANPSGANSKVSVVSCEPSMTAMIN